MFCHDYVQPADEIKSTEFRWKFTTFSMVLHQTLSRRPMTSQIKKRRRDSGLAMRDYIVLGMSSTAGMLFQCILTGYLLS